jgi:hypothetical protein
MLSSEAMRVALVLRENVGADRKGVGPDRGQILQLFRDDPPGELLGAIEELAEYGYVRIERVIAQQESGVPVEFRGIAGVIVLEELQQYLDDAAI